MCILVFIDIIFNEVLLKLLIELMKPIMNTCINFGCDIPRFLKCSLEDTYYSI